MTLRTILLAVGPGDANRTDVLAETVLEVAKPVDARVVLAHVFTREELDEVIDRLDFDAETDEVDPTEVAGRHATVKALQSELEDEDVDYEIRGAVGEHGTTIVDLAENVIADRVIVGGRSRSPTGKAVFGSTAQEVLLSSPAPVTFVRADHDE